MFSPFYNGRPVLVSNQAAEMNGGGPREARALWYVAPGQAEIRAERLAPPGDGEVRVRTRVSALSRGTEALVLTGRVPESEYRRMRAPMMSGDFPFPVKYGYAAVGTVEAGPADLIGRDVFVLHPHQTCFNAPATMAVLLPEDVPPQRAVLAANMETALNAVWDAAPGPADRIAVVGAGVVGALVAYLCGTMAGAQVTLIDIREERRDLARALGVGFALPDQAEGDCDVVFHTSASAAGLANALRLAGDEASVCEMSWYGAGEVTAALGGAFHARRLRLISSQVGQVAASHRPRWTYRRRLGAALALLKDSRLDALLDQPIRFDDVPARIADVLDPARGTLCQPISY